MIRTVIVGGVWGDRRHQFLQADQTWATCGGAGRCRECNREAKEPYMANETKAKIRAVLDEHIGPDAKDIGDARLLPDAPDHDDADMPGVRRRQAVIPTIYHVTPITPDSRLIALTGRHFCVSYGYQQQAALMDAVAAGVMFDNGAFRAFTKGHPTDWPGFYRWLEERLFWPGRWAVIPDVIAEGGQAQDALLAEWPFGDRGAPVYHTGEPIDRLLRLLDHWPRVCIGSTDDHWRIWLPGLHGKRLDPTWRARMDEIWEAVLKRHSQPVIHMLRGTAVAHLYPFHSADSSSVGQNSHRYKLPLFAGTDEEHIGVIAYADRLEARAARRAR